ncbi:MAG: NADH:ubiquinone reductase (Na(+)-transporting) subunit C [Bacteroidales bacterium]|nr:NADH:ubiquinone reductase (Na(+)-transporting) subunit C [Bacteroidales bacterium]
MKNFSNKYMFIYSAALVTVVAVLLALVAMGLKDRQDANIRNEKMLSLLKSIGVSDVTPDDAQARYEEFFTKEITVKTDGSIVNDYDVKGLDFKTADRAFNIKLRDQQKKGDEGAFPVYVFQKDGQTGYVLPLQGNGLWGAVYANLALASDLNTVIGVTFSHDSETPGLGDKITTPEFQAQFVGKQILDDNGQVVSINVKKNANKDGMHEVDAISGGTMTSNGVDAMLATDLARYQKFFDNTRNGLSTTVSVEEEDVPVECIAVDMTEDEIKELEEKEANNE